MVPSGAGLPQGQGIPGISTGHPISSPASLGVGMALPLCAQGFQAPQQTKIYFWLDLWLLLREAGMWPVMPGGNRAGMPEHAAQDTGLCLGQCPGHFCLCTGKSWMVPTGNSWSLAGSRQCLNFWDDNPGVAACVLLRKSKLWSLPVQSRSPKGQLRPVLCFLFVDLGFPPSSALVPGCLWVWIPGCLWVQLPRSGNSPKILQAMVRGEILGKTGIWECPELKMAALR